MSTIDAHVHLYPPAVNVDPTGWAAAQGEAHWAVLCMRQRRHGPPVQSFPTVAELLQAMDDAGVARAVLQGWYWTRPETCALQNRFYAECVRVHPDRLDAFATLHPAAGPDATLAEVRRACDEGLVGLGELSPHSQGYGVDDPVFRAVLGLAAERGLPVTLHVTDPDGREYPGRVLTPLEDFTRLARECPETTIILAHWGGLLPLRNAESKSLANLWYDTAASPLLYDAGVWQRFIAAVGKERVLFGSDYPLNLYPRRDAMPSMTRFISEAKQAGLDALQLEAVLHGNCTRLLRAGRGRP